MADVMRFKVTVLVDVSTHSRAKEVKEDLGFLVGEALEKRKKNRGSDAVEFVNDFAVLKVSRVDDGFETIPEVVARLKGA
jgi:hypothetical protein